VHHVSQCAHNVKKIIQKPEYVIDVVAVVNELLVVFPKANVVEVQRVVGREVQDQWQVWESPEEDHPLRILLVKTQPVSDAYNQRQLLAEADNLASKAHLGP
jgi:hypothetical protein